MIKTAKMIACALVVSLSWAAHAQEAPAEQAEAEAAAEEAPKVVEKTKEAAEPEKEPVKKPPEVVKKPAPPVKKPADIEKAEEKVEAAAPAVAAPAEAPAAAPEDDAEGPTEVIQVTGSRIGRDNLEEFGHIAVVSAEDIAVSGVSTIDELLRKLPSVTLQGINKNNNNGGGGLAFVDLRNLGSSRTLVLVNGRRFVTTGISNAVDLNNIPMAMVERVEVLLDGASAVYGSDAIGGVVNVILKDDFEGATVDLFGGITDDGDGEEVGVSLTLGHTFDKGNVTTNVTFMRREPIWQRDRDWAKDPVVFAAFNEDGSIDQLIGSGAPPPGRELSFAGVYFEPDGMGASFQPYGAEDRYNYGLEQWLTGRTQRLALTTVADYDITDDIEVFIEGMYTRRQSRNRLAPQPIGLGGTATFTNGFEVPWTNPYVPDDFRAFARGAVRDSLQADIDAGELTEADADMIAEQATTEGNILLARRMTQVGPRIYDNVSETFRVVTGLSGGIMDDRLKWELYLNYGHNQNTESIINSVNLARAHEAANPELCAANAHRGCVVGDFFGLDLTQDVIDYIRYTDVSITGYEHFSAGASLAGEVIDLWAGPVGAAIGAEVRNEDGYNEPGAVTVAGDSAGNGIGPTAGDYTAYAAFAELSLPLAKGVTGAEDLTVDFAGRFSDYTTFGTAITGRAALSYAPTRDIRFRGVYSTAFRAPSVSELYSGGSDSYETLTDPCNNWETADVPQVVKDNCAAQNVPGDYNQNDAGGSQIRTNVGGNEELGNETATVINGGVVITPKFAEALEGFSATVDYYMVEIQDAITNPEPQVLLDRCFNSPGLSAPECQRLSRNPITSVVSELNASAQNIGLIETSGLDITVDYILPLALFGAADAGRIELGWHGNLLLNYDETVEGNKSEFAGTITSNKGIYSEWRWLARLAYGIGDFTASAVFRYVGEADIFGLDPETIDMEPYPKVDAVSYIDLAFDYKYEDLGVILGVQNLLDTDPPFFLEGGQNASPESHNFAGRFIFTRLSYDF